MNIVADTNIIMSILIKPHGITYDLWNRLILTHNLLISETSIEEFAFHHAKILKHSGLEEQEFELLKANILKATSIIPSDIIPLKILLEAYSLIAHVDEDDIAFVATAISTNAILWTGDKKLYEALHQSDVVQCYNSQDIQKLLLK